MSAAAPSPDLARLPDDFWAVVGINAERRADVETFRGMLTRANANTNLVGASTLSEFEVRHFIDSAQLAWFAPDARIWADLGSGAGLPGVILAILMKGRPGGHVHLVESMAKRCRFLSEVIEALRLPATLHHARAEALSLTADVVTARACAPLPRLLSFARPYLVRGAKGLFLKGQEVESEIDEARKIWRFSWRTHISLSDPRGRVLELERLTHV
jgi:16S rRNA (guanine527-N7)-methyltransferase